ncbi:uncharacterized protein LOC135680874 isoform X2 [Rhopilema esculentum]|uniref:uncharacterized protein LOC135680874 isoform X2 n=1 Tax=Rhopilema esculentum TaxID=499914 RepID=UPI0031D94BEA
MSRFCTATILLVTLFINGQASAAFNASIRIVHHQYYEDHLFFIQFTVPIDDKFPSSLSYAIEYKCDSSFDIYPLCVTRWQPVSRCDSNTTNSRTYYNCILLHSRVLLNFQYQLRATVKTACGRSENTTRFKVEIPNFSEPVQDLKAFAVDHRTVKLSWKRIDLLRDVGNFRTESIQMIIKVLIQSDNASRYQSIMLKPSVNTTLLHGFLPLRNYTFAVIYHLIVSGLPLPSSKIAAPVTVHMPDIVTRSQPAVNASCVPLFNDTSKLFIISWTIPATPRNIGQNLETKISVSFSGTQMFFTVYQKPETSETFTFDATANTNVEISICNKAGCSNPTSTVCLYAQTQKENSGGRKNTLLLTSCIVGLAILVIVVIASLYYLKKRKCKRKKENEDIKIVYPSVWHQYDEPVPQVQNYVDLSRAMVI